MTSEQRKRLGGVIRRERLAQAISLRQMASRIGISPAYLSQIERGGMVASVERLAQISALLGVNIEK